nr:(2,3-dihydroxybenzoyl)adenylate synthase [Dactylosporangium thailandense]
MLSGCTPWPDDTAGRYRRLGYWSGEVLGDLTRDVARLDGERIAVVDGAGRHTYADVDRRADRLAAGLHGLGLRPGDRAVVQLPNQVEFVTTCLALFRLGVIPVLALPAHRGREIGYLCRHTGAALYITRERYQGFDHRELARQVADEVAHVLVAGDPGPFRSLAGVDADPLPLDRPTSSEVAFFLLSGGTSGVPKLIPRTHDDYACQLRRTAEAVGFGPGDVYLAALPAAHNAALGCPGVLGTLRAGGTVVMAGTPAPDEVFALIARERATLTTVMPPIVGLWLDLAGPLGADLSRMTLQVGGARLSPDTARRVRGELGSPLTHWFGMAEGPLFHTRLDDPDEVAATTQGWPLHPDDEVRVVDVDGRDVARGDEGELLVRGPCTIRGYYRGSGDSFTPDGFLRTGDLVRLTAEDRLVVTGRRTEVVNRGGEKVPAGELEDQLLGHPDVREAAVAALPDPVLGEKTCAFVVAGGPVSPEALIGYLRGCGLAEFKLPDRVVFRPVLPRTPIGKIDKRALVASLGAD